MAIIKIIDSSQFNPVEYKDGDERTILPIPVNSTFTTQNGRVESLVYDLQGNLLNYNPNAKYGIIENGAGGDVELADKLDLYPEEEVTNLGIDVGLYNVYYNILNNELDSSVETPFSLKQISADRKELRLTTSFLTEDDLEEEVSKISPDELLSPYYPDFYLNFGQNRISIVTNVIFDGSNNQFSILVKLYEPLPSFANESDACWLTSKQRDSIAYEVEIEAPPALPTPRRNVLKGPNFSLPLNNEIHSTVKLTSFEELQNLTGITTASRRQLDSILNANGVEVNIDYSNFNNFVHFSSAEERIKNFYSKVGLIEHLSGSIFESSGSGEFNSSSRYELENRISSTIDNFDGFEYFMYFTSQSYGTTDYPRDYPKSNLTAPYTLISTGSANGQAFLDKSVIAASSYDAENLDNLTYTIPEYLLEDPTNEPYKKFVEMIGQHFDTLFVYIKDITNRYNADNRLDFGISKDLVGEAIKSMGINLYTGNFTSNNLVDSLAGTRTPASGSDGQSYSNVTYKTASADVVPVEDVNKEIYKRIYHNLPLLLRQKGSLAGLRTLITCFGIPEEILKIREYDIKGKGTIYDLPAVGASSSIFFSSESAVFPPERAGYIPPKFLSPIIRVQQDFVKSESYDRSLHYTEVGYSPSTYIDENNHPGFDPLGVDFPSFEDFYFGSNMNYYGSKFVGGDSAATQTVTWNTAAFIRYIKFLDSSLFNMIKDFIPVRTSTATGVIIKPTIKERQRQRPAQLSKQSFSTTNISGSALTEGYDFGTSQPITRSIGDYTLRAGAPGLKALNLKDGAYQYPGGTGGSTDNLNRVAFSGETDWSDRDIKTPYQGNYNVVQTWDEKLFNVQSYSNPILGYPTSSLIYSTGNKNAGGYTKVHTGQEELYNGIFQQLGIGIGNFDNYLIRELNTGSSNDGAGVIRTDNNRNNPYKRPQTNTFAGLGKANISGISDFLGATAAVLYGLQGDGIIYIKVGASANITEELLLGNGSTLTFSDGSEIISYTVASPTIVNNSSGTYVAYYLLDNPTLNDNVFAAATLTLVTFIANWNPLETDFNPGEWAYNDFNPLVGNSFDPQAGLINYAGIRKSKFFIDIDYSPSASSSINPINLPNNISQSIFFGSASYAAVQDSNYASNFWKNARYEGIRNTSPDFNIPVIKAVDNIDVIFTSESIGINPFISKSLPDQPQLPQQR